MENINIFFDKDFKQKEKHVIVFPESDTDFSQIKIRKCLNKDTSLILINQDSCCFDAFKVLKKSESIIKFLFCFKNILPSSKLFFWSQGIGCCFAFVISLHVNNIRGIYLKNPYSIKLINFGISPNNTPLFFKYDSEYEKNKDLAMSLLKNNYNLTNIEAEKSNTEEIDMQFTKVLLSL